MLPPSFTPDFLSQLEQFSVSARRQFLGTKQGGHRSPRKGHGIEFSDYRTYQLGDSPRHIDWGVYARTDRLYVRRFQEEENVSVTLIIDASPSLTHPDVISKWHMARDTALAIAYVGLMNQDAVRIALHPTWIGPRVDTAQAIHHLAQLLLDPAIVKNEITKKPEQDFFDSINNIAATINFPGIVVVLSDFLYEQKTIEKAFGLLRARNVDLTAITIQGKADVDPLTGADYARVKDAETGEELDIQLDGDQKTQYLAALKQHYATLARYFQSTNIRTATIKESAPLGKEILFALSKAGVVRC